jgi:hypothetical protein
MPTQRRLELLWVAVVPSTSQSQRKRPFSCSCPGLTAFPNPKPGAVHVGGGLACQWAAAA